MSEPVTKPRRSNRLWLGLGLVLVVAAAGFYLAVTFLSPAPVLVGRGDSDVVLKITNTSGRHLHDVRLTVEQRGKFLVLERSVAETIPPHETISVNWGDLVRDKKDIERTARQIRVQCQGHMPFTYTLLP